MGVLRTIPWDKVDIEVFLIEVRDRESIHHLMYDPSIFQTNKANITEMGSFMAQAGYEIREMPPYDHLFVKKY